MDAEARKALQHAIETAHGALWGVSDDSEDSIAGLLKWTVPALEREGYTITRIDPEAAAVVELLVLRVSPAFAERFGEYITLETVDGKVWQLWDREANINPLRMDGTAVQVLAALRKALKEATDAG